MRREGARKLFVTSQFTAREQGAAIERAGFAEDAQATDERGATLVEFVDRGRPTGPARGAPRPAPARRPRR